MLCLPTRDFQVLVHSLTYALKLCVVHPVQSNVETFLVIQTVPADWSNLAVCTDEVLDPPHVVSEAYILKSVHVIHEPVGSQCVTVH